MLASMHMSSSILSQTHCIIQSMIGVTALHIAAARDDLSMVELLISHKVLMQIPQVRIGFRAWIDSVSEKVIYSENK